MKLPSSRTRCWEQERDSQQPIAEASASWRVRRPLLWKFEEIHFTMSRKYSWENEWNTVKTNTIGIVQKLHLKEFKNNSWYTFEEKGPLLKEGIALKRHKYCKCTFKNFTGRIKSEGWTINQGVNPAMHAYACDSLMKHFPNSNLTSVLWFICRAKDFITKTLFKLCHEVFVETNKPTKCRRPPRGQSNWIQWGSFAS